MTPIEIIRQAQASQLIDEDGQPIVLEMLPALSPAQIDELAARLPCPLPAEIRALLAFCGGFSGTVEIVDFTGEMCSFEQEEIFPHGHPIAADATAISGSSICCHRRRAGARSTSRATTRRWCSIRARRCRTS